MIENCKDSKIITLRVCLGENSKSDRLGDRIGFGIAYQLNMFYEQKRNEGKWEDVELYFEDLTNAPNCKDCSYFISDSSADSCLRRNDIGYEGVCIDGMDYYKLAGSCKYYD